MDGGRATIEAYGAKSCKWESVSAIEGVCELHRGTWSIVFRYERGDAPGATYSTTHHEAWAIDADYADEFTPPS